MGLRSQPDTIGRDRALCQRCERGVEAGGGGGVDCAQYIHRLGGATVAMTLEDLGNIGEFVSALAVVLSLIYVAIQIRQNTRHVRAANYQQILVASVEFRRDLALNPAAAALMEHAREHDDVPMEARPQFHQLAVGLLRLYENLHYQYRKGLIDPDLWPAWVSTIDGFLRMTPGRESYLRERGIFDSHFCDYVDNRIREREVGAV